jgi:cell division protein FtsB
MHKLSNIWSFIGRYKYFFVLTIIVAVVGFLDENSILHRHERQKDIMDLKKEIGAYRERYDKDTRALNGLADGKTLEKYAREKYFMHREDEDLFVIVE